MAAIVKACGYYRLSREDGDKAESDSIKNQKLLVEDYAAKNSFLMVDEYIDDGYSGTNFNRPSFTRLMDDIHADKINCIIVKDLSRLGRNYIEMGKLTSNILPSLGVRLISINDNYDSADEENVVSQIIVPFKNLINDAYCRDISMKIRSQLDMKRRKGKFIGSFALYGYVKDPEDHNHLIIDETAAGIVEFIFNLKMDGYSTGHIVKKLNEYDIPTPLEYKRICGMNYNSGFRSGRAYQWSPSTIDRILRNEMYTGTMIQGKRRKINYKIKQIVDVDRSEWYMVENTHDAIVPKDIFAVVQNMLLMDTRTSPDEENVSVLGGFVKCAECGQNMIRRTTHKNGKKYFYYHCSTYKSGGDCSSHIISEKALVRSVTQSIRTNLRFLSESAEVIQSMKDRPFDVIGIELLDKQIEEQLGEIDKYNNLKVKLYQDMTEGLITRDEYTDINNNFTLKLDRLKASVNAKEKRREEKCSFNISEVSWVKDFLKYMNIQDLDRRIAIALLVKVVVYDKQHIEVVFRHREEMEEIIKIAYAAKETTA